MDLPPASSVSIFLYCVLSPAAMLNIVQDSALLESIGAQTEVVGLIWILYK